jgi:hypothetical protein
MLVQKTDRGLNQRISLKLSGRVNSPLSVLTFPQLWVILKEKRSKKENLYSNDSFLDY